ncbi:MAG TPA: membrane protein insertase YidC [Terrimicrobiaceae bacterium]
MDRKAWIAIIFSILGLVAWQWYYVKTYSPKPPVAGQEVTVATPTPAQAPVATPIPVREEPVFAARNQSLYSKNAEYVFSNDKGGIERAILLLHLGENKQAVFLNGNRTMPIGAVGEDPSEPWGGFTMQTDPGTGEAVFTRKDADGLEITKRFILPQSGTKDGNYVVRMELTFHNAGNADVDRKGYFVSAGGAAPIHHNDLPMYTKFDWMHEGKFQTIDVNWFNASSVPLLGIPLRDARNLYLEPKKDVTWTGVASQYFCTIVTAEKTKGSSAWATRYDTSNTKDARVYGIQGGIGMPAFTLAPGQSLSESFQIYAGPKDLAQLRMLGGGQDAVMNFGMFGFVSEFLLWAMNSLNAVFHSYAAAIIVLTLIIKSLLWPIQNKATNQLRKMSLLTPKMTELREKYKDDPQKMNEEVMKLYKEYGVNPFSGCVPMLIQIPIFFGFYAMLGSAIELRNSSFLWVHDLSQPDTLFKIWGFPVNILPIVMTGTMIWQLIITPKSGDAMQQRIFYFMPVIFLVFCYNYASGLALYWTTQNLFSIVQLYLTRNKPLPTLEKKSVIAKKEAAAAGKKRKKRAAS